MKWIIIVVAALVAVSVGLKLLKASRRIAVDDARRLLKLGGLLLDVRSRELFSRDHIPSAKNIPLDQLKRRQHELGNGHVVIYCDQGDESARATKQLRSAGLTKVHDLGPMARWKSAHA